MRILKTGSKTHGKFVWVKDGRIHFGAGAMFMLNSDYVLIGEDNGVVFVKPVSKNENFARKFHSNIIFSTESSVFLDEDSSYILEDANEDGWFEIAKI